MKTVAVIGSGFGGLAEAIRLRSRGYRVLLFEKREKLGGRAYQLKKSGYTFDMGPSLVTAPFVLERLFRAAGREMSDYVDLVPLDPFYRIYFSDGSFMDYTGDAVKMKEELRRFSPGDAENYDRFFERTKEIYDAVITEGLGSTPFDSLKTFLGFLPRALRLGAMLPAYSMAKRYFNDERNRFAFSFHPLFIGGSPFRTPSVYMMIPYLEREGGVWFAKGGMYTIVEALERLFRELGGEVFTGSEAEEILVEEGTARGVRVNGEVISADAVISNGDVAWTYKHLLKGESRKKWTDRAVDRLHISMSCFLLYIGTRRQYPQLKHHTLILSERYRELVRDIFDRRVLSDDFSMYLHVPSRTDPGMAPEGCESMYVLIPVPHLGSGIDWSVQAAPFREKVLHYLEHNFGMEGLSSSIEVLETLTPQDFHGELNAFLGNAFSLEPRLTQSAYFRPHNRSEDVKHLYIVGAGTHPGGGFPGVLLGAEATEKCVVEDLGPGTGATSVAPHHHEISH
ncbi:MAG: phytoene desaturase family protein [Bacteroidota bacterium]